MGESTIISLKHPHNFFECTCTVRARDLVGFESILWRRPTKFSTWQIQLSFDAATAQPQQTEVSHIKGLQGRRGRGDPWGHPGAQWSSIFAPCLGIHLMNLSQLGMRTLPGSRSSSQHNHNSCRCLLNWFSFCQLGISIVARGQSDDIAEGKNKKKDAGISSK